MSALFHDTLRSSKPRIGGISAWYYAAFALIAGLFLIGVWLWHYRQSSVQIAAAISLTGPGAHYGEPVLDGVRLAIEEANSQGGTNIELSVLDDQSSESRAAAVSQEMCSSPAVVTIGPVLTTAALAAGPIYANCRLVSIAATAHGDDVPKSETTFQPVFNGGAMGSSLAAYLKHVLGGSSVALLFREDGYGRPFAAGFAKAAKELNLDLTIYGFANDAERANAVSAVANDAKKPAVALGMLNEDAYSILIALRRRGLTNPVLAPSAEAGEDFARQFSDQPEEAARKGFFTEHVYAASPIMFDSANAETLSFADRFRQRYGREPSWPAVQGYDSARLAIAAALQAQPKVSSARNEAEGTMSGRGAVLKYLASLDGPAHAVQGVTGPLWFTAGRRREQAVRVGMFHGGHFDSAPVQLVPVDDPDGEELRSGEVFSALPGHFARKQRVVYTGIFINEIPRVDLTRSDFGANFYLWMRYATDVGPNSYDPTDITFPGIGSGSLAKLTPSEQYTEEGISYRLWHVEGQVRNDYDLRRFPYDQQTLRLAFFKSRAAADRIVYVLDTSSVSGHSILRTETPFQASASLASGSADRSVPVSSHIVSPDAFHQLTQWRAIDVRERRENLVTNSPLGDLHRAVSGHLRELSGFVVDTVIERRTGATAGKTLLPLLLMTVIMFASLYFPHGLVKEKVTVAITAALSGAVLLNSVNSQLGNVGYTIAVEYVFYVYFGLSLLCIVSVLIAERLRVAGRGTHANITERWTRITFVFAAALTLASSAII